MNKRIFLSCILGTFAMGLVHYRTINNALSTYTHKPKRVYADMIGDMFHSGHIAFLKQAKQFGDYLIVGLVSDEDATGYKRKPILTLEERVNAVKACKYVDEVIAGSPLIATKDFLEKHKIDVVVHGNDYTQEQMEAYYSYPISKGLFHTVPYTKGISTSDIIRRIKGRETI